MSKKIFLIAGILATSLTASDWALAHNDSDSRSQVCDYSTDFNINIESGKVAFYKEKGDRIEFNGEQLLINGKSAELNDEQKIASKALHQSAEEMLPKIATIAVEGAELGLKATSIAMSALFGEKDLAMQADLIAPIEALADKIKANMTPESFNSQALDASFDDAFDSEFEKLIETAISKYSGRIVGNLLTSIFSGDGEELADLEFRMESMERDIETYVEANAKELEVKADALCGDMAAIAELDQKLSDVEGYPEEGLIQQGKEGGFAVHHFSLGD